MLQVLLVLSLILLTTACGVDTASSVPPLSTTGNTVANTTDDTNTTSSTGGGTVNVVDESSDSGFSRVNAIEDVNACIVNDTFHAIEDSSFDPNAVADAPNGVELASQYSYSSDLEATRVVLYYPTLSQTILNQKVHIYEENYRLSFDKSWTANTLSTVYIRTPKNSFGNHECYRYLLSSLNDGALSKTKVYR